MFHQATFSIKIKNMVGSLLYSIKNRIISSKCKRNIIDLGVGDQMLGYFFTAKNTPYAIRGTPSKSKPRVR